MSFNTNGVVRLKTTPQNSVKYVTEHINITCGAMTLLRDARQEIVWIGTDGQGLYQYTRNAVAFRSITFNDLPYNLSKPVRALYVDHERSLWVGTKGEGLLRIPNFYDRKTFDAAHVEQKTTANSDLLDNSVYTFAASSRNLLWIGTDGDGLNFLAGRTMDFIRTQAMDGTLLAHEEGGVPNIILRAGALNADTLGQLIYFFEYACGLSGYLLDVNPFDQPGVEAYKKNMFALLGKPGYEDMGQALREKLGR